MNGDLANQMKATLHLIECAKDWQRIADDESSQPGVREFARQRAVAVREELRPA